MRFVIAVGSTKTATIEGISAAGANRELLMHTPAADAEIVSYGKLVFASDMPVSPSGCPTPAVITRAVRELIQCDLSVINAGIRVACAAPTITLGSRPGENIREGDAVPAAADIFWKAQTLGGAIPDDWLLLGESIPGGTTTALGVLTALGESYNVSSSLRDNPVELKQRVVADALNASNLNPGDAHGAPLQAIRAVGDPVLAALMGIVVGAIESGTRVTLAGGTQMLAVVACIRHHGIEQPLEVATTPFVVNDDAVELDRASAELEVDLSVIDPGFIELDHPALNAYANGEGKEGVGMGGALMLADAKGVSMSDVRERTVTLYEELLTPDGD